MQSNAERPRTFLDRSRRTQIVGAAIEVIAERGYANTSLVHVAERAGTSKGVVLYHFEGKRELIAEVVTEVFAVARADLLPKIEAETTPTGRLRTYIEARIGFVATHRAHMQALLDIWISDRGPDGATVIDADTAEPTLAGIEALLASGQHDGEFRAFPTRPMAVAIHQAIDGALLQLINHPDFDLDGYAREVVTIFDLATRREP